MSLAKWDDLRFVLAVAEAGSVNAASHRLQVNHATILRRVASFEQSYGTTIFVRNAKGYAVAPDAVAIVEAIRRVETSVDAMERVISGKEQRLDGIVRITSTDSLCHWVLPDIISDFHQENPNLTVELHATNAHENLSKLDADLTIRPTKKLPPELTGNKVAELPFRVFGSPEYLVANTSSRPQDHRWLGVTDLLKGSPVGAWQSELPKEKLVFLADSFLILAEMARTGMGLAMLPTCTGDGQDGLIRAPGIKDRLSTHVWVACHQDLRTSPRITTCMNYFGEALGKSSAFSP